MSTMRKTPLPDHHPSLTLFQPTPQKPKASDPPASMSVLRFLTPAKGAKALPAKAGSDTPTLTLRVPNYGILFVPVPEPENSAEFENAKPREDHVLTGELEVQLRAARRVKCVRVGLKTVMMANFGDDKKGDTKVDKDVLFERKVQIVGGNADGLWLSSGSQKFKFSIIVPANHPVHDWHPNAKITHFLYAELEGLPESPLPRVGSSSSLFNFMGGRRSPPSTSRSASPAPGQARAGAGRLHSPPRSGTSTPVATQAGAGPMAIEAALAGLQVNTRSPIQTAPTSPVGSLGSVEENAGRATQASSMSVTRQEAYPQVPAYEETEGCEPEWLRGSVQAQRSIMLMYNPDPNGGVTKHDDCANGYAPGLGIWNARYSSNVWTVCAVMKFRFSLSSIPPTATLFTVRLGLEQTHSIVSPRNAGGEAKKKITTQHFALHESGRRPPAASSYPGKDYLALWRGPEAGGKGVCGPEGGEFKIDTTVRLPKDDVARPSTPAGVVTPITVRHRIILEVFFSVYGEDDLGRPLKAPGPGGLRVLRITRPAMIPSCSMIPPILDLPTYEAHVHDPLASDDPVEAAREDIGWEWCACGQKLEDMEARMISLGGIEECSSQRTSTQAQEEKIWAERGRQGSR